MKELNLVEKGMDLVRKIADKVGVDYMILGFAAVLVVAFVIFALTRAGSKAKKDRKMLARVGKAVASHGIHGPEDAEAIDNRFARSPELSFRWKRFVESEVLTPYDVYKGKRRRAGGGVFAYVELMLAALGAGVALLYKGLNLISMTTVLVVAGGFVFLSLILIAIYRAICVAQAKNLARAERDFARVLTEAMPVAEEPCECGHDHDHAAEAPSAEGEVPAEESVEAPAEESAEESEGEQIVIEEEKLEPVPEPIEPKDSVEAIIMKINDVRANGASVETMQEIALLLQREREKQENKTAVQQRRLNEALAELLRAMSRYQK